MNERVVMKTILLFAMLVPLSGWAKFNQFAASRKEIAAVLANPVFKKYSDFFIANIRHGEGPGHSDTFFVVLEKAFASPAEKACLMFQSHKANKWQLVGKEGDCKD